jgi:pimeloyl-ACP methyl ester carboxylesterase
MNNIKKTRLHPDQSRATAAGSLVKRRGPLLLAAGAALAAMAAFVQYRTKQVERENPPTGKFVEVDGVRLHYLERGQGQPVVLLHGNGTMAQDYDISGVLDLAADKYRVIAFDRPGYGYSDRPRSTVWGPVAQAELLHRALVKLGVERPVVVGHSWGTMVAVALGLEHPQYVASLVLLSGYYYPTPRLDAALLSPPALPVIGDLMRYTVSPLIGRLIWPAMVRKLFGPTDTTMRFKNEYPVWMSLRPVQLRAAAAEAGLMIPSAYKLHKRYGELKMPVVILSGGADLMALSKLHSERLHKELPQSDLTVVPGNGHMIHHLAPHEAMAAIDQGAASLSNKQPIAA